jgi:hypothetical protein
VAELDSFRVGVRVPVETKTWLFELAARSGVGPVGFFSQCVVLGARQMAAVIGTQTGHNQAEPLFPAFDTHEVHREAETLSTG